MSIFELLYPVIRTREVDTGKKIDNKLATYISYISISLLIAPVVFFSCVVPSMGTTYRKMLYTGLFPQP